MHDDTSFTCTVPPFQPSPFLYRRLVVGKLLKKCKGKGTPSFEDAHYWTVANAKQV